MGQVALAAAGHEQFRTAAAGLFQQEQVPRTLGITAGSQGGKIKACCAAADDDSMMRFRQAGG